MHISQPIVPFCLADFLYSPFFLAKSARKTRDLARQKKGKGLLACVSILHPAEWVELVCVETRARCIYT